MADETFFEACELYSEQLVREARNHRGEGTHNQKLQRAIVLGYLRQRCSTRAEALAELDLLGRGRGAVADAAQVLLPTITTLREIDVVTGEPALTVPS